MIAVEDEKQNARIQWNDTETGARPAPAPAPALRRSNSNISIHSSHSRRGSIDPAYVLPIQYRTVSYQINDGIDDKVVEATKAKKSAARGIFPR
jgi:sodium/potassium-transporting ATPase subunit alpha